MSASACQHMRSSSLSRRAAAAKGYRADIQRITKNRWQAISCQMMQHLGVSGFPTSVRDLEIGLFLAVRESRVVEGVEVDIQSNVCLAKTFAKELYQRNVLRTLSSIW